jgi:aspirochlorine biosynthesis cytochrome P450 monooxygenase
MKWWALDYVFLPPKYLQDLKRAGAHDLNFFENISKVSATRPSAKNLANAEAHITYQTFSLYASVDDLYSSELMIDIVKRGINTSFRESPSRSSNCKCRPADSQ